MSEALDKLIANIPAQPFSPKTNTMLNGVLQAIAEGDQVVRDQLPEFKDQLYVVTADDEYLNRLGQSVGVERPEGVGMVDDDYRDLIPVMSYVPKQIRTGIQELLKIWYGDYAVYANLSSANAENYALSNNQTLLVTTESGSVTITFTTAYFTTIGAATALEVSNAINKQTESVIASVRIDPITKLNKINLRSNVIGANGWLQVTGGSANGVLGFVTTKTDVNSLAKPSVVYEVNGKEIIVVLPTTPSVVKRELAGAWYMNADKTGTLNSGFVFDQRAEMTISSIIGSTSEAIVAGSVKQALLMTTGSDWADSGYFVIDYGLSTQEGPIQYIERPNGNVLVLDPSYVFKKNHVSGRVVNYLRSITAPELATNNDTRAAYVTGVAVAREALKSLIQRVTAAGVTIRFIVLAPAYKYSNPALDTNA
jgi:hypothetical protein